MRYIITLLLAAIPVFAFAQEDTDWRLKVEEMLDNGQVDAALYQLEDTGNRINEIRGDYEQVNQMRYLGELYQQAGKPQLAARWFEDAMHRALEIDPVWKRLVAVIGVLEIHRDVVKDHEGLRELIAMAQERHLLSEAARDNQAKEIGRYMAAFDNAATHSDVAAILQELRGIDSQRVRKRVLQVLTKNTLLATSDYLADQAPQPRFDADAQEKFLWQLVLAKLHQVPGSRARSRASLEQAERLIEQLPPEKRREAKKLLRSLAN